MLSDPTKLHVERITITGEQQWLDLRKQDVTASVVAAPLGLHKFKSAAQLFAEKAGLVPEAGVESIVTRRGKALERVVAEEVAKLHPDWMITKANEYLRVPAIRLGCTPDFFVRDAAGRFGVLQTKTVASSIFKRDWTDDAPPFWIALQIATEMMLADAEFGVIGVLVIGDFTFELKTYDVPRHAAAEQRIRETVKKFWRDVESGMPPKIDFERDAALLAVLFPKETPGKILDLRFDNEIAELLEERDKLSVEADIAESRVEAIETQIKSKLEDAEGALLRGWRMTFKLQTRKAYSVRETSYRVLRIKRDEQAA